jgi:hypothetical protein
MMNADIGLLLSPRRRDRSKGGLLDHLTVRRPNALERDLVGNQDPQLLNLVLDHPGRVPANHPLG